MRDDPNAERIRDEDVQAALERSLASHFGTPRRAFTVARRPATYFSSFHLEEIDVSFDDGARVELMLKDLSRPLDHARRVKPAFLYDPQRELEVYEKILNPERPGTATCYGAIADEASGRYWLFLERIAGTRMKELGEFSVWESAVEWLAALHGEYEPLSRALGPESHLLKCDRGYFEAWMERAQQVQRDNDSSLSNLDWLVRSYHCVIDRLVLLPVTLVHGEFYPPNIMVRTGAGAARICPVDWEMAAVGTGLLDLAALTFGWGDAEADSLARMYYDAAASPAPWSSYGQFVEALDCCRLQLAVQWLGWSTDWAPKHDWLESAQRIAERLGL